jgi:hypothetical protein
MTTRKRIEARQIRSEEGRSIKEVARRVGCSVSSVSVCVRDVPLTEEQREVPRQADPAYNRRLIGTYRNTELCRQKRLEAQAHGRRLAKTGKMLHAAAVMLYWAEGPRAVRRSRRTDQVDVQPVRRSPRRAATDRGLLADTARSAGELPHEVDRQRLLEVQPEETDEQTALRHCEALLHSTSVTQSIYGAIQEYGGFERPEWLG